MLDTGTVVAACLAGDAGFDVFRGRPLLAPDLLMWEAASTLHEYLWRIDAARRTPDMRDMTREDVLGAFQRLRASPVRLRAVTGTLLDRAWRVADQCGFARVYDAAFVALAQQREATLVTLDGRLKRGPAALVVRIVGPTELLEE